MSTIVNPTNPLVSVDNALGGLDIQGFDNQENLLNGSDGNDSIIGGDREDILFSLEGDDTVDGGAGDDWIFGGMGTNVLIGGAGEDTFIFDRDAAIDSEGIDTIEDFAPEEDSLAINGLSAGDRLDYDRDSGILSINGNEFVNIGSDFDFADLDLESDDLTSDNELLVFDGDSVFSLGGDLTLSEAVAARIEDLRRSRSLSDAPSSANDLDSIDADRNSALTQAEFELTSETNDFDLL